MRCVSCFYFVFDCVFAWLHFAACFLGAVCNNNLANDADDDSEEFGVHAQALATSFKDMMTSRVMQFESSKAISSSSDDTEEDENFHLLDTTGTETATEDEVEVEVGSWLGVAFAFAFAFALTLALTLALALALALAWALTIIGFGPHSGSTIC